MPKTNWKKTKILVTGGFGFIGKSVVRRFLRLGAQVVILDNNEYGHEDDNTLGAEVIRGDVVEFGDWEKIPKVDYVYHFAAPSSIILFNRNVDKCVRTTVSGLLNCFNWSRMNGVKKVIYPSSGSVYGLAKGKCSESTLPQPVNVYGKTKLACEYLANAYENYVPSIGLRIFAGYGFEEDQKGDFASVITLFLKDILAGKSPVIFGDGNQVRDFVYIKDIVDIVTSNELLGKTNGVMNIGNGESYSFNQVVETLNRLSNMKITAKYVAKPAAYLENTYCDNHQMLKILKRQPISLEEGLRMYLKQL